TATCRLSWRPTYRPLVELLESRLAPASISTISPDTVLEGSPDVMLTVNGTGFTANSVVQFSEMHPGIGALDLPTTFVSSTQLKAVIPAFYTFNPSNPSVPLNPPIP